MQSLPSFTSATSFGRPQDRWGTYNANAQRKELMGLTDVQNQPRALGDLWETSNRDYPDA